MASKKRKARANKGCLVVIGIIATLLLLVWLSTQFFGEQHFTTSTIRIHDEEIEVYVADDIAERAQGLSDQRLEDFPVDGMLFLFDDEQERRFWMNDMHFTIDIVWIKDEHVVKTEQNILPPALTSGDVQYMYSSPYEVDWVLELPAGGVHALEIVPGTEIVILP